MTRRLLSLLILAGLVGACSATPSPSAASPSAAPTPSSGSAAASASATSSASAAPSASATPSPVQSTTGGPVPTPTPAQTPAPAFALTSTDIRQGGAIPRRFTCDGADVSPALAWTGVPDGTRSLALVVDDPDARGFAHWLAYAIPANMTHLDENAGSPASQ
ncbi:MAG: YbhB/YbcL family Raf kinase inhibitor-like protein, partial [Candidatus Limnocylindrales bacterium]